MVEVVIVTGASGRTLTLVTKKTPPKAAKKIAKVMHEFKEGTLRSGSGRKVTDRKQAIAVALSEAREAGAKIPKKKS